MKRKVKEWVLNHKKQVICGFGIVALIMVFSAAFILQGSNNEAVAKADAGQRAVKNETDIAGEKTEEKSEESIKEDKDSEKTKADDTTAESKTAKKETKDGNSQSAIKPAASSNTGSSKETESKSSNTGATTPSSSSGGNNKSGTGTTSTEPPRPWCDASAPSTGLTGRESGNSNTGTGNSNSGSSQNAGAGNKQSGTSSGSSGSSSGSSGNSNSNTGSAEKNTGKTPVWHEPVYEEKWVVDQAAWTEEVPHYEQVELCICNGCGADITDDPIGHMKESGKYSSCGGYHSEWKQVQTGIDYIQHEEVGHWERVLVQAGYWE